MTLHSGYEVTLGRDVISIREVGQTKSWEAMLEFSKRFPRGDESAWGRFVTRHTAMQGAEIREAMREARRRRVDGALKGVA